LSFPAVAQTESVDDLLQQATQAEKRGDHKLAIERLNEVIQKQPTQVPLAWRQRGRANFCAGNIKESVADFDRYVELAPKTAAQQWERGIAYYYAGEFKKGAKQFEDYQTFHNQDVENSAWRYLCVAKDSGVEKAKANLLKIDSDGRVPMMEIYALYQGTKTPEDVLAAAGQDNLPLFYAHLYIGLWHEVGGRPAEAKTHILEAEKHKIAHYMWDVAHIHAERLRKAEGR
jgi:lipoprotein NlpI